MIKSNFYKPDQVAAVKSGKYYGIEGPDGPPWSQRWGRIELDGTTSTDIIASKFRLSPSSQEDIPDNSIIHGFKLRMDSNVSPNTNNVSCTSVLQNGEFSDSRTISNLIQGTISNYNIYDDFRNGSTSQLLNGNSPTIGSNNWECVGDVYVMQSSDYSGRYDKIVYDTTPHYENWSSQVGGMSAYTTRLNAGWYTPPVAVIDAGTNTGVMGCWVKVENWPTFDFLFRYSDSQNYMIARIVNSKKLQVWKVESGVESLLSETSLLSYSSVPPLSNNQACGISVICEDPLLDTPGSENIQVNFRMGGREDFISVKLNNSFNLSATKCGFQGGEYTRVLEFFHKTRTFSGTYPNLVETGGRTFHENTCGGSTDKWGATWDEIDWVNFVLRSDFQATGGNTDLYLNNLTLEVLYEEISREGVLTSGNALESLSTTESVVAEGGVVASGNAEAVHLSGLDFVAEGGIVASGIAQVSTLSISNITTAGGSVISGESEVEYLSFLNIVVEGGSVVSGEATIEGYSVSNIVAEGGVTSSGDCEFGLILSSEISGGVVSSGESYEQWYIPTQGGITISGEAFSQDSIVFLGGIVVGGSHDLTIVDYVDGTGGVTTQGESLVSTYKTFGYVAQTEDTPVVIGGEADYSITGAKVEANGGIIISGESETSFSFNLDLEFTWSTKANIFKDVMFLWNLGQLPIFWYRIIGKGREGDECNLVADPCCQKYIVNIHARTLSELCEKLSSRQLNLPIESVQRFSRPAERGVAGFDDECNILEPIELCDIPKCSELCIDYDVRESNWGVDMFVQVDSFFDHEITDGVYVGGSADCILETIVPGVSYESEGGMTIGGEATYFSSGYSYKATGGISLVGNSNFSSSSWSYSGGTWPSVVENKFSTEQESLSELPNDQAWSLIERIETDDNLYTSTDISYIKTSEFLIARNFNLNIPSGSDVLGLKVSVERFATQSGVRDLEVYLVLGDDIISDNLADTINDWPVGVSFSAKEYGQNGYDGSGEPWNNEPLDVDDLNSPNFGVAIRVESQTFLPAIIANIDYIFVNVFYEQASSQRLILGGEASVSSSSMSYISDGTLTIGGEAMISPTLTYNEPIVGGIVCGGSIMQIINQETEGGSIIGGEAIVDPIWAEGGISFGGEAKVTPFVETGVGGMITSGTSLDFWSKKYEASGGVLMGGEVGTSDVAAFYYEASGGLILSGEAERSTNAWFYESDGNAIFIFGSAEQAASDFGTATEEVGFSMVVTDMIMAFSQDQHIGDAEGLVGDISQCGCRTVPLIVNLEHNFASNKNILSKFLARNNYFFDRRQRLSYNSTNNSWQSNVHFKGFSTETQTQEVWNIVFELQCTSLMGSVEIGNDIWKLSVQFFRRNLNTGEDFDTRIIIGVLPDDICNKIANELKFTVKYDTQANVAEVDPLATIYQSSIFDNIGLFRSPSWINSPNLVMTVSEAGLPILQDRNDVTGDVLNPDTRRVGILQESRTPVSDVQLQTQ